MAAEAEERQTMIGEVVVTAQRRSERLSEVPITVEVVTAEKIQAAALQDTKQLVQISPSITFSAGSGTRGAGFSLRGISSVAQEGGTQPSVAMVVDGVALARQVEFVSSLADVTQIEVLQGPQGTLFGKNASAGVINITTQGPTRVNEGKLEVNQTTDSETIVKGAANFVFSERARFRVNAFYDRQHSLIDNIGGKDLNGAKSYGVAAKLDFDLTDNMSLRLVADYAKRRDTYGMQMIIVPRIGTLPALVPGGPVRDLSTVQRQVWGVPFGFGVTTTNSDGVSESVQRSWSTSATLNWEVNDRLKLVNIAAYHDLFYDNLADTDSGPTGFMKGKGLAPNPLNYPTSSVILGFPKSQNPAAYYSEEARLEYSGGRLNAIGGAFYSSYWENPHFVGATLANSMFSGSTLVGGTYNDNRYIAKYKNHTAAVFGDVTYKLSDQFSVFGGLRYTSDEVESHYRKINFTGAPLTFFDTTTGAYNTPFAPVAILTGSALPPGTSAATPKFFSYDLHRTDGGLTGRAGIQWRPAPGQNYYVSYNTGFKGPAVDLSQAWSNTFTSTDPEKARAFEIGTKQTLFDGRLFFQLSVYDQLVKDVQASVTVPAGAGASNQLQRAGDIKSRGFEVQFEARLTDELTGSFALAYTHARYRGDGQVPCNVSQTLLLTQTGCGTNGALAGNQRLVGHEAKETPPVQLTSALDWRHELTNQMIVRAHADYSWTDKIQWQLGNDPLTRAPSHGMLNASMGLAAANGRWEVQVYGKNLTNEFFYDNLSQANTAIGAEWGRVARDAKPYGGLRLILRY